MPLRMIPSEKRKKKRGSFKHGKWVKAPVPHADIGKYVDRQTGKEDDDKPGSRVRKEGSTMKFKKPKKGRGPSTRREAGRAGYRGGGRTNLLEELGRVEGEHSNRNRRAEVSRIHGELNKGYKDGGSTMQQHYLQHGYGPTKAKLRAGKPKIAKKGWA